jgi:hypothetical protein
MNLPSASLRHNRLAGFAAPGKLPSTGGALIGFGAAMGWRIVGTNTI